MYVYLCAFEIIGSCWFDVGRVCSESGGGVQHGIQLHSVERPVFEPQHAVAAPAVHQLSRQFQCFPSSAVLARHGQRRLGRQGRRR